MGDQNIVAGQMQGLARAKDIYGMNIEDFGPEVQDIFNKRRAAMAGNDPASTRLKQSKNTQVRNARASGATAGQQAQVERQASADIAQQEFTSQNQAMDKFQSMLGNMIGGTTSLEQGYGALAKSGEEVDLPEQQSTLGTVICTELHRQGYMSNEMLELDRKYGMAIRANDHNVYVGYICLASPIVSLMKKSRLFTELISYPALAWAEDMAYNKSLLGKVINKLGQPVCRVVGQLVEKRYANQN